MLVGCFTPLIKCFLPRWEVLEEGKPPRIVLQQELRERPEEVRKIERIRFAIPRSVGDQLFILNEPREIADPDLIQWLVGGENNNEQETMWSGLVPVKMDAEVQGAMMAAVASGAGTDMLKNSMASAYERAKLKSHDRVMSQIRFLFNNYQQQLQLNKEQNVGHFQFSTSEYLCHYVLNDEITRKDKAESKANTLMQKFADNVNKATQTL